MLADAATKAETVGQGIASQLTSLLGTIQSQGAASFKGGGGTALQNTSQQLGQSLQKLLTALNGMAEAVNASNVQYGSTDSEVSREITSVAGNFSDSPVVSALRG